MAYHFFSVALTVQIRLAQNKIDLAAKEIVLAKRWGQDNLLLNLAEAWVDLSIVRYTLLYKFDINSLSTNGRYHACRVETNTRMHSTFTKN